MWDQALHPASPRERALHTGVKTQADLGRECRASTLKASHRAEGVLSLEAAPG